jgi:hypothetical protein
VSAVSRRLERLFVVTLITVTVFTAACIAYVLVLVLP